MQKVINPTIRYKEDLDDKKISIAIMSSTVILTVQYFILVVFNFLDTSTGTIVQLGSKVVVGIIFAYTFPIVFKEQKWNLFIVYFISIFIFLSHYLFFPDNQKYMVELIFPLFFTCLPMFVYAMSLKNWNVLKDVMKKASFIVFVCGLLLSLMILLGIAKIDVYSMTFSYYMLLPAIMYLDEFIDRLSLKAFFISSATLISILAIGSRGAVLCAAVFIVLKLIKPAAQFRLSRVRMYLIFAVTTISIFIFINLQSLLLLLYNWLLQFGLNSRSLTLFLSGEVYLSGRDDLYEKVISAIYDHPLVGIGIAGDRRVLDGLGVYAHNIFLELLANFGVFIGLFIIFFLLFLIIRMFFIKEDLSYNLLIIWFSLGFVSLFVSGSYLTDLSFWTFLGLMISYFFQKKRMNEPIVRK
ncbi:O-antigen ligase family protein [Ureibacillus acetophenoni]|uniref:O-antigen ligase-related domain-containing protein n=1 Tax=Ureibacillus acetophenoni TaxID=614649 RepID=A0A285U9I4_9BACL|nr:O-antigen ligase family protein [Ureibacillus acetophenoni]SOC38403.1 hypothetical protein SAMN05877842_104122 [Ureibacillus acetophenoni]